MLTVLVASSTLLVVIWQIGQSMVLTLFTFHPFHDLEGFDFLWGNATV
jgi:hypothetical protein